MVWDPTYVFVGGERLFKNPPSFESRAQDGTSPPDVPPNTHASLFFWSHHDVASCSGEGLRRAAAFCFRRCSLYKSTESELMSPIRGSQRSAALPHCLMGKAILITAVRRAWRGARAEGQAA